MKNLELNEVKKRTISGAASYFFRTVLLQGVGLAGVFLLSAFFEPEDFAVYGFVIQIIGILIFFSDIGLAAALVQKKEEPSESEYQTAFTLQQILSWFIVLIVGLVIATGFVEQKVGTAGVWILWSLALSFPLATFKTIPSVILERQLRFSTLVVPQVVEQLLFQGILVFLAWKGVGVISYAYAIVARSVAGSVIMWFLQPWPIGFGIDKSVLKHLIGFGFKFQLNDFLARLKDQLFYLVLGIWLPLRDFGYVQWAKNWSMYPYNLTVQNVMAVTFPAFSRLQHHPGLLAKAIEKSLFFITLLIFPVVVGMSVFIYPLTTLVPEYEKWRPALVSLVLFSLSIGWSALSTPLTNTLNAIGQINTTLKLMIGWTIATWVITPLAIIWFGFNGVALSALLLSFSALVPVVLVKRHVPFVFLDQVWRQIVAVIVMGVFGIIGLPLWNQSWNFFILGMLTSACLYIGVILLIGYKKVLTEARTLIGIRS